MSGAPFGLHGTGAVKVGATTTRALWRSAATSGSSCNGGGGGFGKKGGVELKLVLVHTS